MEKYINNNSFKNILFKKYPFFKPYNLLDNFSFIIYKGMFVPRIILEPYNSKTLNKFFYSPLDIEYNKEISNNDDIKIEIQNEKNNDREKMNNECNNMNNYMKDLILMYVKKDKNYNEFFKENLKYIKYLFKNKNDFEPVPPKGIISALSDNNNLSIEEINKIILNNIDLLSQYNTIYNAFMNNLINHNNLFNNKRLNNFIENNELTISSSKNIYESNIYWKPLFVISENKNGKSKRGRKPNKINKKNKKEHNSSDKDNLFRKLQVHYLSFIINFVNDIIKNVIDMKNVPQFKNLAYDIKKNVNSKNVYLLKTKTISEILQFNVSPKMKIHDESVNKNIYKTICSICPFFYTFFQQNYLSFFKNYYLNNNKVFEINGKKIQISLKTRTFNDLLKKYDKLKDNLKYTASKYLINSYNKRNEYFLDENFKK